MSNSKRFSLENVSSRPRAPGRASWLVVALLAPHGLFGCSGEFEADGTESEERALEPQPSQTMDQGAGDDSAPASESSGDDEGAPNPSGLDTARAGEDQNDGAAAEPAVLDVPDSAHCELVSDWDPEWVQFEDEVLLLVNEMRTESADCGVEGVFDPAPPVTVNPILRCSARLHSLDMFEREFFDHDNPDGIDPFERMDEAGFVGSGGGENIAVGQTSPEEVMVAWMESDGHCANVMRAAFDTLGVGYHPGAGQRGIGSNYWTQNFGAPPFMSRPRR